MRKRYNRMKPGKLGRKIEKCLSRLQRSELTRSEMALAIEAIQNGAWSLVIAKTVSLRDRIAKSALRKQKKQKNAS